MLRNKRGFSLIEMMVVILIIAVMLGVALPHFIGHGGRTSVKVAARDVCSVMRLAHRKAVEERTDYLAIYDCDNETIWVQSYSSYTTSGTNPDHGTEKKLPEKIIIARVTGSLAGQTGPSADPMPPATEDSGVGYHEFYPRGTAGSGSVWLKDKDQKVFYRVTVTGSTGRAKIYSEWP